MSSRITKAELEAKVKEQDDIIKMMKNDSEKMQKLLSLLAEKVGIDTAQLMSLTTPNTVPDNESVEVSSPEKRSVKKIVIEKLHEGKQISELSSAQTHSLSLKNVLPETIVAPLGINQAESTSDTRVEPIFQEDKSDILELSNIEAPALNLNNNQNSVNNDLLTNVNNLNSFETKRKEEITSKAMKAGIATRNFVKAVKNNFFPNITKITQMTQDKSLYTPQEIADGQFETRLEINETLPENTGKSENIKEAKGFLEKVGYAFGITVGLLGSKTSKFISFKSKNKDDLMAFTKASDSVLSVFGVKSQQELLSKQNLISLQSIENNTRERLYSFAFKRENGDDQYLNSLLLNLNSDKLVKFIKNTLWEQLSTDMKYLTQAHMNFGIQFKNDPQIKMFSAFANSVDLSVEALAEEIMKNPEKFNENKQWNELFKGMKDEFIEKYKINSKNTDMVFTSLNEYVKATESIINIIKVSGAKTNEIEKAINDINSTELFRVKTNTNKIVSLKFQDVASVVKEGIAEIASITEAQKINEELNELNAELAKINSEEAETPASEVSEAAKNLASLEEKVNEIKPKAVRKPRAKKVSSTNDTENNINTSAYIKDDKPEEVTGVKVNTVQEAGENPPVKKVRKSRAKSKIETIVENHPATKDSQIAKSKKQENNDVVILDQSGSSKVILSDDDKAEIIEAQTKLNTVFLKGLTKDKNTKNNAMKL